MTQYNLESVRKLFADAGCFLLSQFYFSMASKMDYICTCKRRAKISLRHFLRGQRCRSCRYRKASACRRHEYEYVKRFFAQQGCVLLEKEYRNRKQKLLYLCKCGEEWRTALSDFSRGSRCKKCGEKRRREGRALAFEFVQLFFLKHGCTLLSPEYTNNYTNLRFVCVCGRESRKTFGDFQNSPHCRECGIHKQQAQTRFSFDHVKAWFQRNGCTLLESNYVNAATLMRYICHCGRESKISFCSFKAGVRCKKCATDKTARKRAFTYEFVRSYYQGQDCELLEHEYLNAKVAMRYRCSCGNESVTKFAHFLNGVRCRECGNVRKSAWADSDENSSMEILWKILDETPL